MCYLIKCLYMYVPVVYVYIYIHGEMIKTPLTLLNKKL